MSDIDISSTFPQGVNPLIFYQDMDLNSVDIFKVYQDLLKQQKYEEASEYIKNSDVFYYSSELLNLIENRIYSLQDYLKNEKPKIKHHIITSTEPDVDDGIMWIGGD